MIRDGAVFDDDHLPNEIVGRNAHMNQVTDALAGIENGSRAENCYLFGPSGSGKTTVARAAVRELREAVLDVPTAYINCWMDYTRNAVLERAAKDLASAAVPRNASSRELVRTLSSALDVPSVLILDEVDQLHDFRLFYDLHQVGGLAWICIANREIDLFNRLDDRVQSRISVGYKVRFDRYDTATVTEILDRRAREGLTANAVDRPTLRTLAAHSNGDARTAITALRVAARKATNQGLSTIPTELAEESVVVAEDEVRQKAISTLNDHQRVLYQRLDEHGPLIQQDLYDRYSEEHPDPVSYRTVRQTHLPKLIHYNLVAVEKDGNAKRYRAIS